MNGLVILVNGILLLHLLNARQLFTPKRLTPFSFFLKNAAKRISA